jgi:hypothetical protein
VRADLQRLLDDPALFIVTYFPHRINELQGFHLELIEAATTGRRSLILYPAAHGKTTLVSTLLPIWALCKDPNIRIAIIGKNDTESEGIMQVIQAELVDNAELVRDFGPFKPGPEENKPWALGKMSVAKRTRRAKEATITTFGSGAKTVLGYRTDWTICDDVITEKNSSTPEQRQKIKDWFNLCVSTGPEHFSSRLTVVGTRFDPADLYGDIQELSDPETGAELWLTLKIDAIVDEEAHTTLWPERWPWKRLMIEKASNGTLSFNKRYRNIAVDPSRMVFKEEYVTGGWRGKDEYPGCLDRNFKVGDFGDNWRRASGFDPAVGTTRSAKFCAHLVLGEGSCKHHERCYWVIDLERQQLTLPQQVDMVLAKHGQYALQMSKVEANSYQAGLYQEIERRMNELGLAWRIEPHYTTRTNKPDPEMGVQSMSAWFEQGKIHIPWADQYSQRKMRQLVDELIQYPGRTTDTVMAFWFAWRALESSAPQYPSFSRLPRESPFLARNLGRRVVRNPAYSQQTESQVQHG